MRAELRGFHSMDVPDVNLESYWPDDPESFALSVSASVGPSGERGDEMFDFVVCTARWLAEHPPEKGFSFLRDYILLTRWDYAILERALRDICTHAEGKMWQDVAIKLSRYGHWEFEGYQPG